MHVNRVRIALYLIRNGVEHELRLDVDLMAFVLCMNEQLRLITELHERLGQRQWTEATPAEGIELLLDGLELNSHLQVQHGVAFL